MNDPITPPVIVTEIADLLAQARTLSPPRPGDTAARAAFLAAKADLLARIADQHVHDWPAITPCRPARSPRTPASWPNGPKPSPNPPAPTRRTTHHD